ncbi:MAG TPA: class I fructose-bisphosphate aldolase, partial [Nitrospirota bacterium]|nr:class I fructose-bisphosphate aldolase [Nitrospirota bacterium]
EVLRSKGIIPGIKVDKGTVSMPGFPGEKFTAGLDGLGERLAEYRDLGAAFTKWRAVITIGPGMPTRANILANAHGLALYAALAQDAGLVPVVEPEVLMDGDHDIARCEEATEEALAAVFSSLREYRVKLEGMLLKPNMVLPGKKSPKQSSVGEVAETTLRCLRKTVPAAVPGIMFLSGGQSPEEATEHLNAMNRMGPHPWEISFSYARALQEPPMKTWRGSAANVAAAQRQFYHRAKCNSEARYGRYTAMMEKAA